MPRTLFSAFGIELEYMIVDRKSLDVRPIADCVLIDDSGTILSEYERGACAWSNELMAHVIELKTNGPASSLSGLAERFQAEIDAIQSRLRSYNACLLPTAMHPWMNPQTDSELWTHEYSEVYETFNAIFNCQGHGWANLQSMHINLPFASDEEFGKLHAAIRLLLPILPALAASSPLMDGALSGFHDARLEVYRQNSAKIPEVAGRVIPEPVYTEQAYHSHIFQPLYEAIAPYDPQGILQDEFLNARGAIARFSRGAIEIRVLDVQECPQADLAIAELVVAVLQSLVAERWPPTAAQQALSIDQLEPVLLDAIRAADESVIVDREVLRQFGIEATRCRAGDLWAHLFEVHQDQLSKPAQRCLSIIIDQGCLSRRIVRSIGPDPNRETLRSCYRRLAESLEEGQMFECEAGE